MALADREHFGRAAEECCVSQPTLSTQIKKLEGYLGATLIERNARSFSLTPIGQDIVAKARRIVRQVDDLQSTARTALGPLSELVDYDAPSMGRIPPRKIRTLMVAATFDTNTYVVNVTVQSTDPDNPVYARDTGTVLTGFQMLPPDGG